jgi:hypothetical protein
MKADQMAVVVRGLNDKKNSGFPEFFYLLTLCFRQTYRNKHFPFVFHVY